VLGVLEVWVVRLKEVAEVLEEEEVRRMFSQIRFGVMELMVCLMVLLDY
jgi:hypothetical protein